MNPTLTNRILNLFDIKRRKFHKDSIVYEDVVVSYPLYLWCLFFGLFTCFLGRVFPVVFFLLLL